MNEILKLFNNAPETPSKGKKKKKYANRSALSTSDEEFKSPDKQPCLHSPRTRKRLLDLKVQEDAVIAESVSDYFFFLPALLDSSVHS